MLVKGATEFLLKNVLTTVSNDRTWGLSVRGVLKFGFDGNWRGVLGTVRVVKNTKFEMMFWAQMCAFFLAEVRFI